MAARSRFSLDALPQFTKKLAHPFVRVAPLDPVEERQLLSPLHSREMPTCTNEATLTASLERVNFGDDRVKLGNEKDVSEWQELAEALVELDIQIEELNGWATRPEDIEQLKELEALRDQVRSAIAYHHIPRGLQRGLRDRDHSRGTSPATNDPRD